MFYPEAALKLLAFISAQVYPILRTFNILFLARIITFSKAALSA